MNLDSDDEFHSSNEEAPDELVINTNSDKFRKYKKRLLGVLEGINNFDSYCESYEIKDIYKINKFASSIKEYSLNDNLNESHIDYFVDTIKKNNGIYFLDRVSLVQYNEYTSQHPASLIEIINGHHRIAALKKFFIITPREEFINYKIVLRLDIYHLDNPNSEKTIELFKAFNAVRPQKTKWPAKELSRRIIYSLSETFDIKSQHFIFIKDNEKWAKKPSILRKELAIKLEEHIKEQLKIIEPFTVSDALKFNISPIIDKFITYNNELKKKTIEWFNDIKQQGQIDNDKEITIEIFERTKKFICFIGLVKLEYLLHKCISLSS